MPNERLRDAILRKDLTVASVAQQIGVDPKTVERWITQDRNPYPKHRHAIAQLVRQAESYLWPSALTPQRATRVAESEILRIYPRRSAVPNDLWQELLDQANNHIGILAYAGLFLPEQNPRFVPTLIEKADSGAVVEVALGDPDSAEVAQRGADEGIGEAMASKIHNALAFYRDLKGNDNASVYFHQTTLYNSIYRFDDEMLVNTHLYGIPAAYAPVLHLRRLGGGDLFDGYANSFQRVISKSRYVWP
ncbi:helix-turn-helix domain-containing protein [Actinoplanes sp. HUAS TT8]|uniref:helix-turn-helix domain-containing protein n=1 Tax=Actinoplanes sp. HUAS TT8 TaxID=3447453 RepID=UPI003F5210DB